jgi:nucleoside-diphosphate-sugar epimerase
VTGAGGLIGGSLCGELAIAGHEVIAAYRSRPPRASGPGITPFQLDIAADWEHVPAADAVVHAAAHTHLVPDSTAAQYVRSNVTGALQLAGYLRRTKPKVVLNLSTVSVYGAITSSVLTEDTPMSRPGLYGATKYTAELVLEEAAAFAPAVTVRLPGVVGPGYTIPWLGQTLVKAGRNEPIPVYNPDSMFNNVVDLEELARFAGWVFGRAWSGYACFNMAARSPIPVGEVVRLIIVETRSRSELRVGPSDRTSFSISTARIEGAGYAPGTTRDIVARYAHTGRMSL